jgi:hypothetical protein
MLLHEATGLNPIKMNQGCHKKLLEFQKLDTFVLDYNLALPACFCGIEIEVEGLNNDALIPSSVWMSKEDPSLRNNGIEYISYPIAGRDIVRSLELFYKDLPEEAVFSPRTSIHVHINVLDMTIEEAKRFLVLYLLFEKVLYRFVGKDRDRNIFCVPLQDSYRVKSMLTHFSKSLSNGGQVESREYRYAGLNLACLYKFGTFEFRQLGGTRDIDMILGWINILLLLKKYALANEENELVNSIFSLNTNSDYRTFLLKVFESEASRFDMTTVDHDMERGVYTVKHAWLKHEFEQQVRANYSNQSHAFQFNRKETSLEDMVIKVARRQHINWDVALQMPEAVEAVAPRAVQGDLR